MTSKIGWPGARFAALDFEPDSGQLYGALVGYEGVVPVMEGGGANDIAYLATIDTTSGQVTILGQMVDRLGAFAFSTTAEPVSVSCSLASLQPGESVHIELQMTAPDFETTLINEAVVTLAGLDPELANNTAVEETWVTAVANLSLTKSDDPDPVFINDVFTYTLVVQNDGPATATGVRVMDSLPQEVEFVSVTTPNGICSLSSEYLYGLVENTGTIPLYEIEAFTGAGTFIGDTRLERSSALDVAADGTLYATGTPPDAAPLRNHQNPYLYTIDPTTAITTQVGVTRTGTEVVTDISFGPDDTLYAFNKINSSAHDIGTISITNAEYISINMPSLSGNINGNGLAYSPVDNMLYHANDSYLHVIDPLTGNTVMSTTLVFAGDFEGEPRFNALDFDPLSGWLYGSLIDNFGDLFLGGGDLLNYLAAIDVATGEVSIIGRTVDGLDAIAFKPGESATIICDMDDMGSGTAATITIAVTAPGEEMVVTNTATVTANEGDQYLIDNTAVETTTVTGLYGVELAAVATAQSGSPGTTLTYTVWVTNVGAFEDTFMLATAGSWTASVAPTMVTLGSNEGTAVSVMVDIPASAAADDMAITTVTATSSQTSASVDLTSTAILYEQYLPIIFKP